jgi:hypothetical protein
MSIFRLCIPLFVLWNRLCGYPATHAPCYHHALMEI